MSYMCSLTIAPGLRANWTLTGPSAALDRESAVPVEFKFVLPLLALGELFGPQEQHWLDETGFDLPAGHEV